MSETRKKIEKRIDELAAALGVPRDRLLLALRNLISERSSLQEAAKAVKDLGSARIAGELAGLDIDSLIKLRILDKFLSSDLDLNKVLAIALLKQAFSPDPNQLLILKSLGEKEGGESLREYIKLMQEQQQRMQELMLNILGVKSQQEMIRQLLERQEQQRKTLEEMVKAVEEKMAEELAKRLEESKGDVQRLYQTLTELQRMMSERPSAASILRDAVNEYRALREAFEEIVDMMGIPKTQVVTPEGKLDLNGIIDRVLRILEKRFLGSPPPYRPPLAEAEEGAGEVAGGGAGGAGSAPSEFATTVGEGQPREVAPPTAPPAEVGGYRELPLEQGEAQEAAGGARPEGGEHTMEQEGEGVGGQAEEQPLQKPLSPGMGPEELGPGIKKKEVGK